MVRQIDSEIKTGLLYEKPIKDIIKYAKIFGAYAIHPDKRLVTEELLREAIKNNTPKTEHKTNIPFLFATPLDRLVECTLDNL